MAPSKLHKVQLAPHIANFWLRPCWVEHFFFKCSSYSELQSFDVAYIMCVLFFVEIFLTYFLLKV
jgi:hypothetical protein